MSYGYQPQVFTVTVSGGTGSAAIRLEGRASSLSIIPPAANTQYDLSLDDADGYPLIAENDLVGKSKTRIDETVTGSHTVTISDCPDGVYKGKVRWKDT